MMYKIREKCRKAYAPELTELQEEIILIKLMEEIENEKFQKEWKDT